MATVTLRPNGAGSITELTHYGETYNWMCVDDVSSDSDTSYVTIADDGNYVDYYTVDVTSIPTTARITSVNVYAVIKTGTVSYGTNEITIKAGGSGHESGDLGLGNNAPYTLKNYEWTTNPDTGVAWTRTSLDSLQIGVDLSFARCTQIYVVITFALPGTQLSSGPLYPTLISNNITVGTYEWFSGNSAKTENEDFASVDLGGGVNISYYLVAQQFGFSIPTNARIDGIVVEIKRWEDQGVVNDYRVRIMYGEEDIGTVDRAAAGEWPGVNIYKTYGSSSDLWGRTWTYADINSDFFGVALSVTNPSGGPIANVDDFRITVYYTETTGTGYKSPTTTGADANQWTNPTYAYSANDQFATTSSNDQYQNYATFDFGVPSTALITGLSYKVKAKAASGTNQLGVYAYSTSYDDSYPESLNLTTTNTEYTFGSPGSTGGVRYIPSDLDSPYFFNIYSKDAGVLISVDHLQVEVYYIPGTTYTKTITAKGNIRKNVTRTITSKAQVNKLDTGWKSPSAYPIDGTHDWTNGGNLYTENGQYTTAQYIDNVGHWGGFGFSIPSYAIIGGIEFKIKGLAASGSNQIVAGFNSISADTDGTVTVNFTTDNTEYTFGDSNELFGTTWLPSDFNDGTVIFLLATMVDDIVISVDHVQAKIYYTIPAPDLRTKTLTAKATIKKIVTKTLTSKARLARTYIRTVIAGGSIGTAAHILAKADIKQFAFPRTVQAKGYLGVNRSNTIEAKAELNHRITQTFQALADIFKTGIITEPTLGGVTLPFPSEAIITPKWVSAENLTLEGESRRGVIARKYEYTLSWDYMSVTNYDLLEAVVNTLSANMFIYGKWPQSAGGINCLSSLSARTLKVGTGDTDYWSSVTLTLTEVESRI